MKQARFGKINVKICVKFKDGKYRVKPCKECVKNDRKNVTIE